MPNRNFRWLALTLLALVNLLFWAGVAIAVGLIVSPGVDFGLEGQLREGQATLAAVWEQLGQPRPSSTATPVGALSTPRPAATGTEGEQPIAAILPTGDPVLTSAPEPDTTQQAESSPTPAGTPTAKPEPTLASSPLLLADPEFSNLTLLDAEMARSAPDRAVQIRYQETMLNAEIAALWRNNPELPYRDVWVDLQRDRVVVTGKLTVLGFQVDAEVSGDLTVKDCVPVLEIEALRVAGVMTPAFVRDQVERMVLDAMSWYTADYPLCLEQIVLEDTYATLYGYRR